METTAQIEQVGMSSETASDYVKKCLEGLADQMPRTLYRHLEVNQALSSDQTVSVEQFIEDFIAFQRENGVVDSDEKE